MPKVVTNKPPVGEKRKESSSAAATESGPKKKKVKKNECNFEGCTKYAQKGGLCMRHGGKRDYKRCSSEGCTNQVQKGGVCRIHGAKAKLCSIINCTYQARKGRLCRLHRNIYDREMATNNDNLGNNSPGNNNDFNAFHWPYPSVGMRATGWSGQGVFPNAVSNVPRGLGLQAHTTNMAAIGNSELPILTTMPEAVRNKPVGETKRNESSSATDAEGGPQKKRVRVRKICTSEGCTKYAQQGGVCIRHGAKVKLCSVTNCINHPQKGGVCVRHGAKVEHKLCSSEGCKNYSQKGGVCITHGARGEYKRCSVINCTNFVKKGRVCFRHRYFPPQANLSCGVVQDRDNRNNTSPLEVISDDEEQSPTTSRKRKADVTEQFESLPPSEAKDIGQVDEAAQDSTVAEGFVDGGSNNDSEKSHVRGGEDFKNDKEEGAPNMRQGRRSMVEGVVYVRHEKEQDATGVGLTQKGEGGGSDSMGGGDDLGGNDQHECDFGRGGDDGDDDEDINSAEEKHSHVVPDEIITAGDSADNGEKDSEIHRLNVELEKTQNEVDALKERLKEKCNELETINSQSQADRAKQQLELKDLRNQLTIKSSQLEEKGVLAVTLEANLRSKELEMKEAKNEVVTLKERSKQMAYELGVSESRNNSENEQIRLLSEAIEEKSQEIEDLEAQLKKAITSRLREYVDKKAANAKLREATNRQEATSEAAAKLQVEVDKLKAEKGEMEARLQISTRNEEELRSRVEELELTNAPEKVEADESFWSSWEERKKLLARSKNKQSQLKAKVKQLKEENTSLRDQLEKQSGEEIEVKEEEMTDDEELKPLTSRLKERHTKKVIAEAEARVLIANAKVDFAELEVLRHQDKLDEATATIEEERLRRRQEMEESEATQVELRREIDELRRTNETLRQKLPRSRRSSGSRSMGLNGGSLANLGP